MAEVKKESVPASTTPENSVDAPAEGIGSKKWFWIVGIVVGVLVVAGLLYWLI